MSNMTGAQLRQIILANDLPTLQHELPLEPTLIDYEGEDGVALSFVAAQHGDFAMLRYLVEYGLRVNLNTYDHDGRDLLHYAAMSGDVEKCRYLVERGGMDPLRGDLHLETPFDIAHRLHHTDLEAYFASVVGAAWEDTYHNPVRTGFFPDPSIVRVGEDYYMVNSTFIFFPCIPVSHSRDLVNWRVIGHAIENPDWAHVESLEGGRGWWAPDISYSNGRFYITATLRMNDVGRVRRRQMVVTAERPEGPYSEPVFFDEDGIDPSLFHDDDGRHRHRPPRDRQPQPHPPRHLHPQPLQPRCAPVGRQGPHPALRPCQAGLHPRRALVLRLPLRTRPGWPLDDAGSGNRP